MRGKPLLHDFRVPKQEKEEHPTAEQVGANKQKWGWDG